MTSLTPALMMTPLVPAARMPARVPSPLIVIDLVMVTAPNPPGSRTEISPPSAVLEIAPANVLHGAVRLQGLASLPTPDTQVRVAWPKVTVEKPAKKIAVRMKRRVLGWFIRV